MVFLETPTNPTLELFGIADIARRAHAYGAIAAVDNTFASPGIRSVIGIPGRLDPCCGTVRSEDAGGRIQRRETP